MTTKTEEEDGAARVWEFLHRQLHLISDCNSHTHTHVCIYTTAQMCMSLSLSLSHSLTHSAWIFMYSRVKWHLKHVSSSIALAHVAGHDANEEHSRSLYKCAQCTYVHMHVSACVCVCVWLLVFPLAWLPNGFGLPWQAQSEQLRQLMKRVCW